jgi:conjugative relaxase-like TrwC/TraI family protein
MLSVRKIDAGKSGAAAQYFCQYYAQDEAKIHGEPAGKWLCGYVGEVRHEQLLNAFKGMDENGQELIATMNGKEHAPGWDLTFSTPKSVSAVWAAGSEELREAIAKAHSESVQEAMHYLRKNAFTTRHGKGGGDEAKRVPGSACTMYIAEFEHSTTRANDPELHSHLVVMNMAKVGKEHRCLDFNMRQKMTAGALYRCVLAEKMQAMGFGISEGKGGSFELVDVDKDLQAHWSKRSAQIKDAVGEGASAEKKAVAAVLTRKDKEEPDRARNFEKWGEEARGFGFDQTKISEIRHGKHAAREQTDDHDIIKKALKNGIACRPERITELCLNDAAGATTASEAFARADRVRASMIEVKKRENGKEVTCYTTLEMVARETQMHQVAEGLHKSTGHGIKRRLVDAAKGRKTLSADQEKMLEHCCKASGIAVCQGYAGSGKSYALDAVRDAHEAAGYKVVGCAPSAKAASGLQGSAQIKSDTIAMTLINLNRPKGGLVLDEKTLLVVDEAGMVGTRDMSRLLEHAAVAGAKVVLVGDQKQLAPIEAGSPFADFQQKFGYAELIEVRRQKAKDDVEIANALRIGQTEKARELMRKQDAWHVAETQADALKSIAEAYATDRLAGLEAACFAGMRADVAAINLAARDILQRENFITGDEISVRLSDDTTLGLRQNDRVIFTKNDKTAGVRNGEIGDIVSVNTEEKTATVRILGDDPREITIQGLTGNPEIDDESLALDMLYGHAMTVHKSQGATIKKIKTAGESIGKGGNGYALFADNAMTNSNLAYVAGSRNEGQFHLFCSKVDEEAVLKKAAKAQVLDSLLNYKIDEKTLEAAKDFDLVQAAKEEMSREIKKLLKADQKKGADKAPPLDTVAHVEGAAVEPSAGVAAMAAPAATETSPELAERIDALEADLDHMRGEDLFELRQEWEGWRSDLEKLVEKVGAKGIELPEMPDLAVQMPNETNAPAERVQMLEEAVNQTRAAQDQMREQTRAMADACRALEVHVSAGNRVIPADFVPINQTENAPSGANNVHEIPSEPMHRGPEMIPEPALEMSPELAEKIGMLEADLDQMCGEDLFELEQEHRGYSSMCSDLTAQAQDLEKRLGLPLSLAPELPQMPDLGRLVKPDPAHTPEERAFVLESAIERTATGIEETRAQIRGLADRSASLAAQLSELEKRLFAQRKTPEWAKKEDMFQEKNSTKEPDFMREMELEKTFGERLREVGKMPHGEQARALDKIQSDTAVQSMERQAQERATIQSAQIPEHSQSLGTGQKISRGRR